MKKASSIAIALVALVLLGTGCGTLSKHRHFVFNPMHWAHHGAKIFSPTDGELHMFHIDIDRVLFGIDNYDEFDQTETIYTSK